MELGVGIGIARFPALVVSKMEMVIKFAVVSSVLSAGGDGGGAMGRSLLSFCYPSLMSETERDGGRDERRRR